MLQEMKLTILLVAVGYTTYRVTKAVCDAAEKKLGSISKEPSEVAQSEVAHEDEAEDDRENEVGNPWNVFQGTIIPAGSEPESEDDLRLNEQAPPPEETKRKATKKKTTKRKATKKKAAKEADE